ncbi:uncharacterized protein LOC121380826 [Gigantopelta aegis]|uniref:uncharacterized protein LOC121380826 n=1 Tax=Gigantopelta aegis TaxID=1735272 RepID=UPI001B88A241|nr:uncharacterized protein LOC121380826 [Gigantopelta aegis]
MLVADTVCLDTTCTSSLPPMSSDANFASVLKPVSRVKDVSARLTAALGARMESSAVTFITAASSNHFLESQALIKNLHRKVFPSLDNFTFYYYDLGLEPQQRHQLEKFCKCEVRSYPFHVLPWRFGFLRGFTWKVILMQAHLPFTDILVWVDSSIRFLTGNLEPMFKEARSTGLLLSNVRFSVSEHTSEKMFSYFGDRACEYSIYNEVEAGFQVVHNEPFVRDLVLKTWWACAVDPDCMSSEYHDKQFHCSPKVRSYSKCHRFDQSAHTLILAKLFRENIATFYLQKGKYHVVKRKQTEHYFEELEKKGHK